MNTRLIDQTISATNAERVGHPTQKPLLVMLFTLSFVDGDLILDPFAGSGTTGVACIRTGRRFIGVEKEPKYFEIALRRIREAERMAHCNLFKEPKPVERKQLSLV
jgi:site-specific DNA-methyltransferase (adenine-specific)/modification methylase